MGERMGDLGMLYMKYEEKCEACKEPIATHGCATWCNECGIQTNHSTDEHFDAAAEWWDEFLGRDQGGEA